MEACEKSLVSCPMLGYTEGSSTQLVIRAQEDGFRSGWREALEWVLKYHVDLEMGDWTIIEKELEDRDGSV